jgi:hypothetical protein
MQTHCFIGLIMDPDVAFAAVSVPPSLRGFCALISESELSSVFKSVSGLLKWCVPFARSGVSAVHHGRKQQN